MKLRDTTFWTLMNSLKTRSVITLTSDFGSFGSPVKGIVQSIQAESGSGKTWNIVMLTSEGKNETFFVRTID